MYVRTMWFFFWIASCNGRPLVGSTWHTIIYNTYLKWDCFSEFFQCLFQCKLHYSRRPKLDDFVRIFHGHWTHLNRWCDPNQFSLIFRCSKRQWTTISTYSCYDGISSFQYSVYDLHCFTTLDLNLEYCLVLYTPAPVSASWKPLPSKSCL